MNASKNLQKLTSNQVSARVVNNASDIPGTLLNMALLNLGNDDDQLRLAAYDMLDALCQYFDFKAVSLLGIEGLGIPTHSFHFIVTTSERLAATQAKLTLEFLLECLQGLEFSKVEFKLKNFKLKNQVEKRCDDLERCDRSCEIGLKIFQISIRFSS